MCSGAHDSVTGAPTSERRELLVGEPVRDNLPRSRVDVELRVHAEIDDLRHCSLEARPVLGSGGLRWPDVDTLGPDGNTDGVTGSHSRVHGHDDSLAFAKTRHREPADDLVHRHIERVQRADEVGYEGGLRALVHLARASDLLDAPPVHDGDAVGHRQRLLLVVRDVDERRAELVLDALQLQLHLLAQFHVQRTERLVEQQCRRTIDERASQGDPLLLPPRQLARAPALQPLELHDAEDRKDPLAVLGTRHLLHLQPEGDVVVDRHVGEERVLLEDHVHRPAVRRHPGHVLALEQHAALVRHLEACDHAERRRLPAATRPEQREELAFPDGERHVPHGLGLAVALGDAFQSNPDRSFVCHAGGSVKRHYLAA